MKFKATIKTFILLAIASLGLFGQTTQEKFNAAYWAAQPVEVQQTIVPLLEKSSHDEVTLDTVKEAARKLADKGYTILVQTMVYGKDPYKYMVSLLDYGYTWYPSLKQVPIAVAPGIVIPNYPMYDPNNPPVGSVKVSIDLADYPPAVKPAPPVIPTAVPAKPLFTVSQGVGRFSALPGDSSPDGTPYSGPEGSYVKRVVSSPFGAYAWWEVK